MFFLYVYKDGRGPEEKRIYFLYLSLGYWLTGGVSPWFLYQMVDLNAIRTFEVKQVSRFFTAFISIDRNSQGGQQSDTGMETCARYSELPSDVSTMVVTQTPKSL